MSALAERPPVLLPRPLNPERLNLRAATVWHVARVLIAEPEQFETERMWDVLRPVPYLRPERAASLLRAARVDGLKAGADLTVNDRIRLARVLAKYAKGNV